MFARVKRYLKAAEFGKSQENLSEYTELETKLRTCESESKKTMRCCNAITFYYEESSQSQSSMTEKVEAEGINTEMNLC